MIEAAAQVAWALCKAGRPAALSYTTAECNSFGLSLLEPRPLSEAFAAMKDNPETALIVLENDLFRRAPTDEVDSLLHGVRHLVAFDHLGNTTTEAAELVLPAGTFAESDGTLVNSEGRAQRYFQVFDPSSEVQSSWRWLAEGSMAAGLEKLASWHGLDELTAAMSESIPALRALPAVAPPRSAAGKIAREPIRYSGRTAMLANISVHEPKPPDDPDSALAFSMESGPGVVPPALRPFFWAPGWNSVQSVNKFQDEIGGPLRGDHQGVRLIEPSPRLARQYFSAIPSAFAPQSGSWLLIPIFHIFGSEELSRHAPGISQLTSQPYLALNPVEASLLGVKGGELLRVLIEDSQYELEVALRADLPRGIAGLHAARFPFEGIQLPVHCRLVPVGSELSARGAQ
jgi:NADH-quinone oxidoreductase subunit G